MGGLGLGLRFSQKPCKEGFEGFLEYFYQCANGECGDYCAFSYAVEFAEEYEGQGDCQGYGEAVSKDFCVMEFEAVLDLCECQRKTFCGHGYE